MSRFALAKRLCESLVILMCPIFTKLNLLLICLSDHREFLGSLARGEGALAGSLAGLFRRSVFDLLGGARGRVGIGFMTPFPQEGGRRAGVGGRRK